MLKRDMNTQRSGIFVYLLPVLIGAAVFVACGSGTRHRSASPLAPPSTAAAVDANLSASDFRNVNLMTRIGDHFIDNVRGQLAEALAVAHAGRGSYPVGTIIQLVPQEAMVKRRNSFSPATNDWEFFSLDVSPTGTRILARGGASVLNRFGGSCASCHSAARTEFDFVCGTNHGCAPLPIGPSVFAALQRSDPRPRR